MRGTRRYAILIGLVALVVAGGIVASRENGSPTMTARRSGAATGDVAKASPAAPTPARAGATVMTSESAAQGAGATAAPAAAASVVPQPGGAKIVKTAELRVEVGRNTLQRAIDEAATIAGRYDGFVASSSKADEGDSATGTLTIRVPASHFDDARRDLGGLGKVKGEQLSGEDVTGQLVDYDARITSLQAQEDALRTLLGRATRVGEVLEVQGQLFNVRQQIEQLKAQRAQLNDAADLSTITIRLFEPGAPSIETRPEPSKGLAHDLERAWDGAIAVIGGMVIVVGYLTPIALLALLVWALSRLRRVRVPDAAATR